MQDTAPRKAVSMDNYLDVVKLRLSSGDAPDIMFGGPTTYPELSILFTCKIRRPVENSEIIGAQRNLILIAGRTWMILKDSPNVEIAKAFFEYMTRPEVNADLFPTRS